MASVESGEKMAIRFSTLNLELNHFDGGKPVVAGTEIEPSFHTRVQLLGRLVRAGRRSRRQITQEQPPLPTMHDHPPIVLLTQVWPAGAHDVVSLPDNQFSV